VFDTTEKAKGVPGTPFAFWLQNVLQQIVLF